MKSKQQVNIPIVSQLGDMWLLGKHRILCGDTTDLAQVKLLMQDEKADMAFTDPPYNVNYKGRKGLKREPIVNDNLSHDEYKHFLLQFILAYQFILKRGASFYLFYPCVFHSDFEEALKINCFTIRNQIVWVKNHFVLSFARYKAQHELILYCYKNKERDKWCGDRKQSTVWQFPKPQANFWHPTMKPVSLIEKALLNSSEENDVVVDLFGGSGSTLIACEKRHRQARLMEVVPQYVDATIYRWQEMTNKKAIHYQTRKPFGELLEKVTHK